MEFINTKAISQKLRQGFWSAHQIITNKNNYLLQNNLTFQVTKCSKIGGDFEILEWTSYRKGMSTCRY